MSDEDVFNAVYKVPESLKSIKINGSFLSYNDSLKKSKDKISASHVLIWSKSDGKSPFRCPANVMMHLRFDGTFGFPGGLVDPTEDPVQSLNRELREEIGAQRDLVSWNNYVLTMIDDNSDYILHLFVTEVPLDKYNELEKNCLLAREYGKEVLGTVRVPLYSYDSHHSRSKKTERFGFSAFLDNVFVSVAKFQLLAGLHHAKIMTEDQLRNVLPNKKRR